MLISNETFIGVSVTARVLIAKRERIFSQTAVSSRQLVSCSCLGCFHSRLPAGNFQSWEHRANMIIFSNFANMSNDLNNFSSLFDLNLNVNY